MSYKLLRFKSSLQMFFYRHKHKIIAITASVVLIAVIVFAIIPPVVREAQYRAEERREINRFKNLSIAEFIYDFDYLMHVLEENWPFFNLSISANGVDVHELADNVRSILHDPAQEPEDPFAFLEMLREEFFNPINQLGHLSPIPGHEYFFGLQEYIARRWSPQNPCRWTAFLREITLQPETIMFYTMQREADEAAGVPEAEEPERPPVLEVSIIEEGRTAMLRMNRMIHFWDDIPVPNRLRGYYRDMMHEFYGAIGDFEHLILDFRGNRGGVLPFFDVFVMGQLLHETIALPGYVLYTGGAYSARAREVFDTRFVGFIYDVPAEPAVLDKPLPYLDTSIDFQYFYVPFYGLASVREMYEHGGWGFLENEVAFNGKIWLLTSGDTASAAEAAVAIIKYNNIAAVVGEATRGMMGVTYIATRTNLILPNTGIFLYFDVSYFVDPYGRPLQGYGIMPHYPNRPGMDALETVLAMIEENW